MRDFLEAYLTRKIGAEIKCCLMFFMMLCYVGLFRFLTGGAAVLLRHLLEMMLLAYVLQWIQVLLKSDFDEIDRLSLKEWAMLIVFSAVDAAEGHLLGWFDGSLPVAGGFFLYMMVSYLCIYWIYAIKRHIDAKFLNHDLKQFQQRKEG